MKGRKKGTPNYTYKRRFMYDGENISIDYALRDKSQTIRCSAGFKELLEKLSEKENCSQSDVLHRALKLYGLQEHDEITLNLDNKL